MREFLEALWAPAQDLFGELRFIHPDGRIQQSFVETQWISTIPAIVESRQKLGFNAYFGVLRRTRAAGTAADVVSHTSVLWADLDAKSIQGVTPLQALNSYPIPPSFVADSGGGVHAYWLLDRAVSHAEAVPVMRDIAKRTGGDNVHDAPRVLRLPGTLNMKYDPPRLARLLKFDPSKKYRFGDLESLVRVVDNPPRRGVFRESDSALPSWLIDLVELGVPQGGRSEACFRAMIWLIRYGRSREAVRAIFQVHPYGIGEKMAGKGERDGNRWFDLTFSAAEELA